MSGGVEKLHMRVAVWRDSHQDAITPKGVFQTQDGSMIVLAAEVNASMSLYRIFCEELIEDLLRCGLLSRCPQREFLGVLELVDYVGGEDTRAVVIELDAGVASIAILIGFEDSGLVLLVLVKAYMKIGVGNAVGASVAAENKSAVFGAFVVEEQYAGAAAVRASGFLPLDDGARILRFIGKDQARSAIWFHKVDAVDRDLIELGSLGVSGRVHGTVGHREEDSDREYKGKGPRIEGEEARVGEDLHGVNSNGVRLPQKEDSVTPVC